MLKMHPPDTTANPLVNLCYLLVLWIGSTLTALPGIDALATSLAPDLIIMCLALAAIATYAVAQTLARNAGIETKRWTLARNAGISLASATNMNTRALGHKPSGGASILATICTRRSTAATNTG